MPVVRTGNLAGQVEFINLDDSARWLGPRIGGHYWPAMHRTADGRWFAARWTLDGYDGPPGRPLFAEVTAEDAAGWFEASRLEIPPELVADLANRPAPPPAAGSGRTAQPTERTNRAESATVPGPAGAPDREATVAEYLREHPDAASPDVFKGTGIPEGTLRKLAAWKAHQARRKAEKPARHPDAMQRARPLSEAMVAAVPARTEDPAELAEAREAESLVDRLRDDPEYRGIVESEYRQTVDPSDRAAYHRASRDEQITILAAWKLTGMS